MVDLEGDQPIFRLGEALYQGVWQDMVGTELYSNFGKLNLTNAMKHIVDNSEEGEIIGTTRTRIQLAAMEFEPRPTAEEAQQQSETGGASAKSATQEWVKKTTFLDKVEKITAARLEKESQEHAENEDAEAEDAEDAEESESMAESSQEEDEDMDVDENEKEPEAMDIDSPEGNKS